MVTILLVRHADIDLPPTTADPPLNHAGRRRAEALAHVVGPAGPAVIAALGGPQPPVIPETEFDNLFVVTLTEPAGASLLALKYGREQ